MKVKEYLALLLLPASDMLTTYFDMARFKTFGIEKNAFIKALCLAYGYNALLFWIPLEFIAIAISYSALKMLRSRLKVRIEFEKIFLILMLFPAINNIIFSLLVSMPPT
jgi:hypothetical protein